MRSRANGVTQVSNERLPGFSQDTISSFEVSTSSPWTRESQGSLIPTWLYKGPIHRHGDAGRGRCEGGGVSSNTFSIHYDLYPAGTPCPAQIRTSGTNSQGHSLGIVARFIVSIRTSARKFLQHRFIISTVCPFSAIRCS